jgi:hypothetical protein
VPRGAIQKCGTLRGYKFENYGFDKNVLIWKFACESSACKCIVRRELQQMHSLQWVYAILTADNKRFRGLLLQPQSFFKATSVNVLFFSETGSGNLSMQYNWWKTEFCQEN